MDIELCTTTGLKSLDDLLHGLVLLFELSFPARIQSYYLGGSYSDGTAVGADGSPNSSDIDLFVIFRGSMSATESTTFQQLVTACRLISPIQIDAHAYYEDDLLQPSATNATQTSFTNMLLKISSKLIYGEDICARLPEVSFPCYVLDVIESGLFYLAIPRQQETLIYPLTTPLIPALTYPDATAEFYGYDYVPTRPEVTRGTRVLVGITAWIMTLILALETGHYAGQKSQCLQLCKTYLPDDKRIQFAITISDMCKIRWGYTLPTSIEDRERLHSLCHDILALENEYLWLCRSYVLTQLQQEGLQEQKQATRLLQNVVYADDEIKTALGSLLHSTDETVQASAVKALELIEHAIPAKN